MFEITYKNNEYIYREFYKYYLFRRPSVYAFWIILICTYFMQLASSRGRWELVSFFPMFMFMQIYIYSSKARTAYKKACSLDGTQYTYTYTADDEKISFLSDEGISYDIDYGKIRSYAVYSDLIILFTFSKKYCILPKDSFVRGKSEEFTEFLENKGIKCENRRK